MQNTAKFSRNIIKYMSVQQFWNLSQLLGVFTCLKLQNLCQNFVAEMCKQQLGSSHDVKGLLPLVHFWSVLLLIEQMMTSVRKTLKTLVWSVQNRSISAISSEICPKITSKSAIFLPIAFRPSLPRKFPWNSRKIGQCFRDFVPKNPAKFDFFFLDLSEVLLDETHPQTGLPNFPEMQFPLLTN